MMNSQETQKLRNLLARREWQALIEQLQRIGPGVAADFFMTVSYDEQRALFHEMPVEVAVTQWAISCRASSARVKTRVSGGSIALSEAAT